MLVKETVTVLQMVLFSHVGSNIMHACIVVMTTDLLLTACHNATSLAFFPLGLSESCSMGVNTLGPSLPISPRLSSFIFLPSAQTQLSIIANTAATVPVYITTMTYILSTCVSNPGGSVSDSFELVCEGQEEKCKSSEQIISAAESDSISCTVVESCVLL